MILTSKLGKHCLWLGQPFLLVSSLEPTPEEISDPNESAFIMRDGSFTLEEVFDTRVSFRRLEPDPTSNWILSTPIQRDIPAGICAVETLDLGAGVYEVAVSQGSASQMLPELVWILERDDYAALAREEASEEFETEPTINNATEFTTAFRSTLFERWPDCPVAFQISYVSNYPVSYSPIAWTLSHLLDAIRYLGVFGIRTATGFISVGDDLVELGIDALFEYPLPEAVTQTFHDSQCSDLLLMKGTNYIDQQDVDVEIDYGRAKIAVRQPVPALATA